MPTIFGPPSPPASPLLIFLAPSSIVATRSQTSTSSPRLRWAQHPTAAPETPAPTAPRRRPPATRCPCSPRRSATVSLSAAGCWCNVSGLEGFSLRPLPLPADLFDFGTTLPTFICINFLFPAERFIEAAVLLLWRSSLHADSPSSSARDLNKFFPPIVVVIIIPHTVYFIMLFFLQTNDWKGEVGVRGKKCVETAGKSPKYFS